MASSLSEMKETRHQFHESLIELERQTLSSLDMVLHQLDRALESVTNQDVELAGMVMINGYEGTQAASYLEVHQGAGRCSAAGAGRRRPGRRGVAAYHPVRRIGDAARDIAKLVPL